MTETAELTSTKPKKRKRIFLWTFLAIQAVFVLWITVGITTANNTPNTRTVASVCDNGGWKYLYNSQAQCEREYGNDLNAAGDAGTALGVGLIIGLWTVTDIILGIGRLVVVTSRHKNT